MVLFDSKFRQKNRDAIKKARGCEIENCPRPHKGSGLCNVHYQRKRLGKDMNAPIKPVPHKHGVKQAVKTGQRFGRLVVVRFVGLRHRANSYLMQCDCGNTSQTTANRLLRGTSRSCGCLGRQRLAEFNLRHGHARHAGMSTRAYHVWTGMKGRCFNTNDKSYSDYGGRGITICERWLIFDNFLADMGEPPTGMSIDRFPDMNGNYEPGNCRWATITQQNRNKRTNAFITFNGQTRTISHWAELLGVPRGTLRQLLRADLSIEYVFQRCEEIKQRRERGERHRGKAFNDPFR